MAEFEKIVQEMLRQASFQTTRGGIPTPLIWLAVALLVCLVVLGLASSPTWLAVCVTVFLGVVVSVIVASFSYIALKNPDALRTERYLLTKTALDKTRTLTGDNLRGIIDTLSESLPATPAPQATQASLSPPSSEGEES